MGEEGLLMVSTLSHSLCPVSLSRLREFLGQGWMKTDKTERTPYIMKTSQHFNDVRALWNV